MTRSQMSAELQRAYVASLADVLITINTEGIATSYWPAWESREFLLTPDAPAPVLAVLDAAESI